MLHQTFLAIVIFYQFTLALRDYIITGVLAKGLPPDGRFHAYVLVTTLEVTAIAFALALSGPVGTVFALKLWTVYLCWFGGGLDWIYFIAIGTIPDANKIWYWMPRIVPFLSKGKLTFEHPTTTNWTVYTALMWVPCMICWTITLT